MSRVRVAAIFVVLCCAISCDCFHRVRGTVSTRAESSDGSVLTSADPPAQIPVEGATVLVYPADAEGGRSLNSTRSGADGSFDSAWCVGCVLPAREYRLVVMKEGYTTAVCGFLAGRWEIDAFVEVLLSPDTSEVPSENR